MTRPCRSARSSSARRMAVEYDAPVGLLGSMTTSARGRRDEAVHVIEIGRPSARRIGAVEAGARAELREHRRVQRIRRHRHQHVAVLVDDRAQGQIDRFRRAGGDEHAVGGDRESAGRVLVGDRFTGLGEAGRRSVAVVAVAHRALDRGDEVRRRLESERDRIADVEIANRLPLASTRRASATMLRIAYEKRLIRLATGMGLSRGVSAAR